VRRGTSVASLVLILALAAAAWGQAPETPGTSAAPKAPDVAVGVLTLLDCVEEALVASPEIGASRAALRAARSDRKVVNAGQLPPFTFTYSEIFQPENTRNIGGGTMVVSNSNFRTFEVNTTFGLFSGGLLTANRRIAALGEAAAGQRLQSTVNGVIGGTVQAYLQLLRAQELKAVSDRTVDLAREQLKIATVSFEAGAVPKVNVLRAQAAVQNALQGQVSAGNGIELARAALLAAMGRRQGSTVAIAALPRRLADPPDLLDSLQRAVAQRPELRAQQSVININHQAVKLAQSAWWPQIGATAKYNHTQNAGAFSKEDNWQVMMLLQLNVWDWGKTAARVNSSRAQLDAERNKLERAMRDIELEVRRALLSIAEARQRVEAAGAEVQAAGEARKIEEVRYSVGEGIYLEMLDARRALSAAEANLVNAYYDNALAEAAWLTATGSYVAGHQLRLPGASEPRPVPAGTDRRGRELGDLQAEYGKPGDKQ